MERRDQFQIQTSFPEACQYLQTVFFPKAKEAGIGAWVQLLSPRTKINEPSRFAMYKILERRMSLTVQVEQIPDGRVFVSVLTRFRIMEIVIASSIFAIPTCGLAIIPGGIVLWLKSNRLDANFQKAVAILKNDLGFIQ
jgi:hypothetical protein